MKKLNNLNDAIKYIESQTKFTPRLDLNYLTNFYQSLNFENINKAKKIHVAGTNGKGSTCKFLTNILVTSGKRVGTFMSPYLVRFNERILLNNQEIADDDLLDLINRIYLINETKKENHEQSFSFFELITLMSLMYFNEKAVDVIIMEVGIGGRYDATNILTYDVSLITNIGTDHLERLGPTINDVANNKLGILKPNGHLITTVDKDLKNYFKKYADHLKATVTFVKERHLFLLSNEEFNYEGEIFKLGLIGDYQRLNAALAIETCYYLYADIKYEDIYEGVKKTRFHGRFEQVDDNIFIDGAHNIEGAIALRRNVAYQFHHRKVYYLISMLADKDVKNFLNVFTDDQVILTSFNDVRFKSLANFSSDNHHYIADYQQALLYLKNQMTKEDVLIIMGSLHFIGELKQKYFK